MTFFYFDSIFTDFVPKAEIENKSELVQVLAWH